MGFSNLKELPQNENENYSWYDIKSSLSFIFNADSLPNLEPLDSSRYFYHNGQGGSPIHGLLPIRSK